MLISIIIIGLISFPLFIAFLITKIKNTALDVKKYSCWGLAMAFLFFFTLHLVNAQIIIDELPHWIQYRNAIVYSACIVELAIALSLFFDKLQVLAAQCAIAIFMLIFPINIYFAFDSIGFGGHQWGPIYLFIRGPMQLILIAWAYYLCIKIRKD